MLNYVHDRYYGYDGNQVNVEELVLQHFARTTEGGWSGIHTEGGVWATLFGLVLWDVLFMGARGMSIHLSLLTRVGGGVLAP